MSKPIGVGMLGAGFIGMIHSYALRVQELIRTAPSLSPKLVALADLEERARGRCQEWFGWQDASDDWHDAVDASETGLFINSAPNHLHLEPTLAAARKGKHVLCEKPLAQDADTAYQGYLRNGAGVDVGGETVQRPCSSRTE